MLAGAGVVLVRRESMSSGRFGESVEDVSRYVFDFCVEIGAFVN